MTSQPPAAERLRIIQPLGGLTTAVTILLGLPTAVSLVAAFQLFDRASLLAVYQDAPITPLMLDVVEGADTTVTGWLLLFGVVYLATGTVFIIWHHRYASNAVILRGPLTLGPGWAVGGWFIPLANFVLPFLQLNQSARASDPALPQGERPSRGTLPRIQTAWTSTFVAAAVLFTASTWTRPSTPSADASSTINAFTMADRAAGVAFLLYTVAGVLAVLTVRTLTRRQTEAIAVMHKGSS
jgi:hypothetical protein